MRRICTNKTINLLVILMMTGFFATTALAVTWDYYHADHLRPHIETVDTSVALNKSKEQLKLIDTFLPETGVSIPIVTAGLLTPNRLSADTSLFCASPKAGRSPPAIVS